MLPIFFTKFSLEKNLNLWYNINKARVKHHVKRQMSRKVM